MAIFRCVESHLSRIKSVTFVVKKKVVTVETFTVSRTDAGRDAMVGI